MAAKESTLGLLHEAVAKILLTLMEGNKVEVVDEETGEVTISMIPPSAAEIQAAAKFLKDNDITAVPDKNNTLGKLTDKFEKMKEDTERRRLALMEKQRERDSLGSLADLPIV